MCESGYSPSLAHTCTRCSSSRRQGLLAATVIAALVALAVVVAIFKFLLSTKVVEEENVGWFHRRVLRAVPVQALKIVVVVWQILTQVRHNGWVREKNRLQDIGCSGVADERAGVQI